MRVNFRFRNFHTTVWKLWNFSLTLFRQKFRESNVFTKEITKEMIWRNILIMKSQFPEFLQSKYTVVKISLLFTTSFCLKIVSWAVLENSINLYFVHLPWSFGKRQLFDVFNRQSSSLSIFKDVWKLGNWNLPASISILIVY